MKNQIVFSSDLSNLFIIENLIDQLTQQFSIKDDIYGNILISIHEAVKNAILHGNKENPDKKVIFNYFFENSQLKFTITDEGDGFDYDNIPDPTTPENIENIAGRGIFLIKNLADSVVFNKNGSEINLYFNL